MNRVFFLKPDDINNVNSKFVSHIIIEVWGQNFNSYIIQKKNSLRVGLVRYLLSRIKTIIKIQ